MHFTTIFRRQEQPMPAAPAQSASLVPARGPQRQAGTLCVVAGVASPQSLAPVFGSLVRCPLCFKSHSRKIPPKLGSNRMKPITLSVFFLRAKVPLQGKSPEIFAKLHPHIRPFQRKFDGSLQHSEFVAGVEPFSLECVSNSKTRGVRTYRPMMACFDGASSSFGFSTIPVQL